VFLRLHLPSGGGDSFAAAGSPPSGRTRLDLKGGPALVLPAESSFFHRAWNETLRLEAWGMSTLRVCRVPAVAASDLLVLRQQRDRTVPAWVMRHTDEYSGPIRLRVKLT
jgi:hypothetical protein